MGRWMCGGWQRGRHNVVLVEGGTGLVEGDAGSSAAVVWWRPMEESGAATRSLFSFLLQKRFSSISP
jgi:hypothetical protein